MGIEMLEPLENVKKMYAGDSSETGRVMTAVLTKAIKDIKREKGW